jgi:hypothetical protein
MKSRIRGEGGDATDGSKHVHQLLSVSACNLFDAYASMHCLNIADTIEGSFVFCFIAQCKCFKLLQS